MPEPEKLIKIFIEKSKFHEKLSTGDRKNTNTLKTLVNNILGSNISQIRYQVKT
jgi:hypothetical protein